MQGTKNYGCQWNTILNLVLSSLGFVKHAIDHALYILKTKYTKNLIIVGCYKYDSMYAYSSTHLFQNLIAGINNYFPMTSKEGP